MKIIFSVLLIVNSALASNNEKDKDPMPSPSYSQIDSQPSAPPLEEVMGITVQEYTYTTYVPTFKKITRQVIDLSGKNLTKIPDSVFKPQNQSVEILDLMDNELIALDPRLKNLPNLKSLLVGKNQIKHVPEWLGELTGMTLLCLSDNPLEAEFPLTPILPYSLSNLKNLQYLFLENCGLFSVPDWVWSLPRLERIDIWHESSVSLFNILQAYPLKTLDVRSLGKGLPKWMFMTMKFPEPTTLCLKRKNTKSLEIHL